MGRHPKVGASYVNVTVKIPRELYMDLQLRAVRHGMSHVLMIEKMLKDYVSGPTNKEFVADKS